MSHRYLWGPAVDQLFADEQPTSTGSAGNVLWALGDNLGTIRDIADLSGSTTSVTNHRRFGAYGNLVSESNAAVDMLFAYTGKLYDENTKLQNNLFRWYDAARARVRMSEDPLGFAAADENVRRYVGNLAVASVDPLGLMELPLAFNDVADFMATMNTSNLGPSSSGSLLDNYCDTFRSIFGNALVDQSGGMIHSILTSTVMSDETLAHMSDGAVLAGTTAIAAALVLSRGQVVNVAGASLRLLNTPILRIPALTIPRFGSGGGRFALAGGGQLGQATTLTLFPAIPIDVGTAAVLTGIGIYMTGGGGAGSGGPPPLTPEQMRRIATQLEDANRLRRADLALKRERLANLASKTSIEAQSLKDEIRLLEEIINAATENISRLLPK